MYIAETAHPSVRASLAVMQAFFLSMGFLIVLGFGYLVGYLLAYLIKLYASCNYIK